MAAPNPFQNLILNVATGERIFTEGEVGTTMFIVQSGRIRLFREYEGKAVEIAEMEKGDFFGEMSLLEGSPRSVSAEAIDDVELIEINSTTFDRMIRGNIEIAVRLLRKLSARLQRAEGRLAERLAIPEPAAEPEPARSAAPPASPFPAPPPAPPEPPRGVPVVAPLAGVGSRPAAPTPVLPTRPTTFPGGGPRLAGSRAAGSQGPRLVAESGEAVFPLVSGEALLGRYDPVTETQPEVDLTLLDIKRSVSRRHAKITSKEGSFYLTEEVGALNGTFINGIKLVTGRPAPLKTGDRISLGTVHLVLKT